MTDWNTMPDVGAGRCVCGAPALRVDRFLFCAKSGKDAAKAHDREDLEETGEPLDWDYLFHPRMVSRVVRRLYRKALHEQQEPQP